jgi:hypothetical protein
MTLFDLLFIAIVLGSAATLIAALVCALSKKLRSAGRIMIGWGIAIAVYLSVVLAVGALSPRRVLNLGDQQCSDDWCIAVESAEREVMPDHAAYRVTLRLSSRALRVAQRETGLSVYLLDSSGRRYDPLPPVNDVPLDVQLAPGESANAVRVFHTDPAARDLVLVIAHEGGFPIGRFIIGGQPLSGRTVVRMP